MFELRWADTARETCSRLRDSRAQQKRYKAVSKTLHLLAANPRHSSLQTHEYVSLKGPNGEKVFEACAEQSTPAAYRVFFYHGPDKGVVTILAITPHP